MHKLTRKVHFMKALRIASMSVANLVLCCFLVFWAISNVNLDLLLGHLHSFSQGVMVAVVALGVLSLAIHGLRMHILSSWPLGTSFQIVTLGAGMNIILPFRLGDLARIYYARRYFALSGTKLVGIGLVEKFFDLVAVAGLTFLLLSSGVRRFIPTEIVISLGAVILIMGASFFVFKRFASVVEDQILGSRRLRRWSEAILEHAAPTELPRVAGSTLLIWITNVFLVFVAFSGFLPEAGFGVLDALCVLIISALAIALPGAPAGVGIFEAGIVTYLKQALEVTSDLALACAIVFHAAMVFPYIVLMACCMIRNWHIGISRVSSR